MSQESRPPHLVLDEHNGEEHTMRLGFFGINGGATYGPDETNRLARLAEELGYDSIWAGERVVAPSPHVPGATMAEPTYPILDPLIHLTYVAAATERLLLATGVLLLAQRNPVVLAKQAASLDVLSGGRFVLGIGVGSVEQEMTAIGVPMADRGARTDDYLAAMRALWTRQGPVAHAGPFASFSGVDAHPRPLQTGGPRIIVGGHSPAAFRRAVAHGHGWYGLALDPEAAAQCIAGLRRAADEVERPAELGELEITVTPAERGVLEVGAAPDRPFDRAAVEAFGAAGVDRLVPVMAEITVERPLISSPSPDAVAERLESLAELVV
jgi:probable F420-dependent oxidoreductase